MSNHNIITAVISGGASGLGLATAEAICSSKGTVCLLDINQENGTQARARLGSQCHFIPCDVSKASEVEHAIKQSKKILGEIRLLVNCSGIAPSEKILAKDGVMPVQDFERVISINLLGSFYTCRSVVQYMQHNSTNEDGERGVIINTASIAAFDGQIGQTAYSASKGALVSMTLPMAREFARFGIRVMCVAPGLFQTPLFNALPEKAIESLREAAPFPKRVGKPSEFAELILHIYNNTMFNGETIRLDGALRM